MKKSATHSQSERSAEPTALANSACRPLDVPSVTLFPFTRILCALNFLLTGIPGSIQVGAYESDLPNSLRVRWHFPISPSLASRLSFKVDTYGQLRVSPVHSPSRTRPDLTPDELSCGFIVEMLSKRKSEEVVPLHEDFEAFRRVAKGLRVVGPAYISLQDGVTVVYRMAAPSDGWCTMVNAQISGGTSKPKAAEAPDTLTSTNQQH